jgi:hypothetical protein
MNKLYGKETSDKIVIRIGSYEFVVRKVIKEFKTFKELLRAFKAFQKGNHVNR